MSILSLHYRWEPNLEYINFQVGNEVNIKSRFSPLFDFHCPMIYEPDDRTTKPTTTSKGRLGFPCIVKQSTILDFLIIWTVNYYFVGIRG